MSNNTPSLAQLKRAITISEQIEALQSQLASILGGSAPLVGSAPAPAATKTRKGKRTVSPEARAKMAAAQKARWAKKKGGAAPTAPAAPAAKPAKRKGGLTPEGRAKLAAAMKARWDARKKGAPAPTAKAQKPVAAPKVKAKRVISPEARAKMAAAAKKRWANAKK